MKIVVIFLLVFCKIEMFQEMVSVDYFCFVMLYKKSKPYVLVI